MRAARTVMIAVLCGAALEVCPLGCKNNSNSAAGDDAGDAADDTSEDSTTSEGSAGDDGGLVEPLDALPTDDTTVGNCTVPSGLYTVTATPSDDSGPGCSGSTWTEALPTPTFETDAGVICNYTPNGSLPVCAITFTCGSTTASESISIIGYISIDNTSFEGTEQIAVTSYVDASSDTSCSYTLTYAKQ